MAPVSGVGGPIADWYEYGEISSRELIDSKRDEKPPTTIQLPMDQYAVNGIPQDIQVRVDRASSSHIDAGLRLHSVLSGIGSRDDLERVIAQAVKHGTVSSDPDDPCSIESINTHVSSYIMDAGCRVAAWFDPANRVYSERTITSRMSEEKKKKLEEAGKPVNDDIDNLRPDRIAALTAPCSSSTTRAASAATRPTAARCSNTSANSDSSSPACPSPAASGTSPTTSSSMKMATNSPWHCD